VGLGKQLKKDDLLVFAAFGGGFIWCFAGKMGLLIKN
jgi:hypothetical protein